MHYLVGPSRNGDDKNCSPALVEKAEVATLRVSSFLDGTEVVDGNLVHLKTVANRGTQSDEKVIDTCE